MTEITVAIPSKGRLREGVIDLMAHAGIRANSSTATSIDSKTNLRLLEMRPRDAAEWLRSGRIRAGFVSTDAALEAGIDSFPSIPLGFASSDLVLACRTDSDIASIGDLEGKTIATHLPQTTTRWLESKSISADVVALGGSLEGVCALGLADAIVDLRQTGNSLAINSLETVEVMARCQATFTWNAEHADEFEWFTTRIQAAVEGRKSQYLIFHIPSDQVANLGNAFEGIESPTVIPLQGRDDLVAAHVVVKTAEMWSHLPSLRAIGASGLVTLPVHALLP